MWKKGVIQHYNLRKHCPYCRSTNIKLMTQTEFYGKEYSGAKLWVCQKCNARAGCHKGTEIPMGCLADDELRKMRIQIHKIIDGMWKTKQERIELYKKLSLKYGDKFHVGFLNNERANWVLFDLKNNC